MPGPRRKPARPTSRRTLDAEVPPVPETSQRDTTAPQAAPASEDFYNDIKQMIEAAYT